MCKLITLKSTVIYLFSFLSLVVKAQHPVTVTDPANCLNQKGAIIIAGFDATTAYSVIYNKDSTVQPAVTIISDSGRNVAIRGLEEGSYTGISITPADGGSAVNITQEVKLRDKCIARQAIQFLATGYGNFTGVQDDNPTGYAQVYARLTIPLHKSDGLPRDTSHFQRGDRFILFRNVFLQLTYGNTDKFKLYSFDSSGTRYVNRLDLLAHNYFNANLTFNFLTYIMPRVFNRANKSGDRMHIYLDGFTSLILTNVTDSAKKIDTTNKKYNVKTPIYGLNIKGAWDEGRWRFELAFRRFWMFPATNAFNTKLNPQSNNIEDIYLSQNAAKPLVSNEKKVKGYNNIDAVISYKTAPNPTKSDSKIFLRYSYSANSPSIVSTRYNNNYFQFQLGYSFDVTQVFKPQAK